MREKRVRALPGASPAGSKGLPTCSSGLSEKKYTRCTSGRCEATELSESAATNARKGAITDSPELKSATLDSKGRWFVGDVGGSLIEEVNVVTSPGQNFGWPWHEGECDPNCDGSTPPLLWWDRTLTHRYAVEDPRTPQHLRRVVWVGNEYRDRGDYDNALRNYKIALSSAPSSSRAYANMGRLYTQIGDRSLAIDSFRRAYEINAAEPGVAEMLAQLDPLSDSPEAGTRTTSFSPEKK